MLMFYSLLWRNRKTVIEAALEDERGFGIVPCPAGRNRSLFIPGGDAVCQEDMTARSTVRMPKGERRCFSTSSCPWMAQSGPSGLYPLPYASHATGGSITLLRGDAVPVVLDQAERLHVDLIVMASHGRVGLNARFSGSVAARITGRTSCPLLLLVRAGTPVDEGT